MRRGLKQFLKRTLKLAYRLFGWAIPAPLRNELMGYRRYRWSLRAPPPPPPAEYGLPYWERREKPDPAKTPVRVGFVGAGAYAQHHLKVLSNLERVTLGAILTTGGPRAQEAAARYNIARQFSDIDDFLALPDIDCYVVVVPIWHTYAIAMRCLASGKPVLLEKPPGLSSGEAAQLEQQARQHGAFGMVCMNRRFYSVLEHGLAPLADCGPLRGAMLELPQAITAERQSKRLADGDYDRFFVRNSIHGVDLLRYILGDPLRVHSLTWPNPEFKNAAASFGCLLEYDRGVVATITDLWDTPQVWRLKVVAEAGWLEFQPLEQAWFVSRKGQKTQIKIDPVDTEFRAGVYSQDLHFIEAVRQGRPLGRPACLLPDAHKTMLLMEQIVSDTLHA